MNSRKRIASYALFLCSLFWSVAGQATGDESSEQGQDSKNEIAVFLGITHEGRRDNAGALGLEYERRINKTLGIGALAEFTAGDSDFWVYAIPLSLHFDRWKLVVAPGLENCDGHTEWLVRLGAGYEFEAGGTKITPGLNVDFVDGDAVVIIGIAFGIGF
jgi:hypothetical protein